MPESADVEEPGTFDSSGAFVFNKVIDPDRIISYVSIGLAVVSRQDIENLYGLRNMIHKQSNFTNSELK